MIDCQYMNLSGYHVYLVVLQYMNDNFPHMRTEIGIDLKVCLSWISIFCTIRSRIVGVYV